jgi:DNA repair ATPase RecN
MQKAIAIVSQDEQLSKIAQSLQELDGHFKTKLEFLKKQAADLQEDRKKQQEPLYNALRNLMQDKGVLPANFNPDKDHIHIDHDMGAVVYCDGEHEEHPILEMLRRHGIAVPMDDDGA